MRGRGRAVKHSLHNICLTKYRTGDLLLWGLRSGFKRALGFKRDARPPDSLRFQVWFFAPSFVVSTRITRGTYRSE